MLVRTLVVDESHYLAYYSTHYKQLHEDLTYVPTDCQ